MDIVLRFRQRGTISSSTVEVTLKGDSRTVWELAESVRKRMLEGSSVWEEY